MLALVTVAAAVASAGEVSAAVARPQEGYQYPDTDGALDCLAFESRHKEKLDLDDLNHQLADDGELSLFRTVQTYLEHKRGSGHDRYLDVGCGTGRIIGMYAGLFKQATCLEADAARIRTARQTWKSDRWGRNQKMQFVKERFEVSAVHASLGANASYDAITCIQVVQHIPESLLPKWLSYMFALLKPQGLLVLATKHALIDKYQLSDLSVISRARFNAMARHPSKDGRLAVRSFAARTLEQFIRDAGFSVIEHAYSTYEFGPHGPPDTQIIVAAKHPMPQLPAVPLANIYLTPWLKHVKIRARRKCKKPCPGAGESAASIAAAKAAGVSAGPSTPADYIGC